MKVLITGSKGQLGSNIYSLVNKTDYKVSAPSSEEFNFLNKEDMDTELNYFKPDIIINCAAYTDVEDAEKRHNREYVFEVNTAAVMALSHWCKMNKSRLIQISTDYALYPEYNWYAQTKKMAEDIVLKNNQLVLRTSHVYDLGFKNNLLSKVKNKLLLENVSLVDDVLIQPISAFDLAKIIVDSFLNTNKKGIYNICSQTQIDVYSFVEYFVDGFKFKNKFLYKIHKISSDEFHSKVKRPKSPLLYGEGEYVVWQDSLLSEMDRKGILDVSDFI